MCSLPTQPTYGASLPFSLSQSDKTAAHAAADHGLGGAAEAANRTHFSSCTTLAVLFTAELLGFCLFSKSGPPDPYRCVKHRHPSSEYPAEVKLGRIIFYCLQTGIQTGLRHHVILALTFELPLVTAFFFFGKSLNSVQLFVTPWTVAPPPVSSVHGILQARALDWVAAPFFRGSSQPRYQTQVSHIAGGFFAI